MRIIKFRVFDLQTDKMYKVVDIDFACGLITATETDSVIDLIQLPYDSSEFSILEQFTGLKDKNGKEIYEGCIDNYNRFVVFENGSFRFKSEENPNDANQPLVEFTCSRLEIIGNIHEDKNLLK